MEMALAGTLWIRLFLLIGMLVIGRSVGAALFLSHFDGFGLSVIYMAVGVTICSAVVLVEYLTKRTNPLTLEAITQTSTLIGSCALAWLLPLLSPERATVVSGFIYLAVEAIAFLATVQFWSNANSIFSLAQARRYYTFIGTGGICGSIAGGIGVRWLAASSVQQAMAIIAVLAALGTVFGAVFTALLRWQRRYTQKHGERWNLVSPDEMEPRPWNFRGIHDRASVLQPGENAKLIRLNVPSDIRLGFGMVALMSVFATTLIDYYYKTYADVNFAGDVRDLTSFFGSFYLLVGVSTLLTQLFVTRSILLRRSAFWGLFISPFSLLVMTMVNVFLPGLWPVTAFKLTDSALAHSVNRSCQELLYTPLPTLWVRSLKATSEGLWGRGGLLAAGVLLVTLALLTGHDQTRWLLAAIVIVLSGWAVAVAQLRYSYNRHANAELQANILRPLHWDDLKSDPESKHAA